MAQYAIKDNKALESISIKNVVYYEDSNTIVESTPINAIANIVYPIGSIYFSINSVSPQTLFGGTWERIQDKFLLASGSTYSNGTTGGAATHKLAITEIPSHQHQLPFVSNNVTDGSATTSHYNFIYGKGQRADAIGQKMEMYNSDGSVAAEGDELAYNTAFTGGSNKTSGTDKTAASHSAFSTMPPYLAVYI